MNKDGIIKEGIINVGICQFPVKPDIEANSNFIQKQIVRAKNLNADIVHFPENALTGLMYNYGERKELNFNLLKEETKEICKLAREQSIWIIVGTIHQSSKEKLPYNSIYLISPSGQVVKRYDKHFVDLNTYSPGDHFSVFKLNGVKCGMLICHDVRYPELYRKYYQLGVKVIFQSFYNACEKEENIFSEIIPASMQTRAASNYFWISASNSSAYHQSYPGMLIRPDGIIVDTLTQHQPEVVLMQIDINQKFIDASKHFRDEAIAGFPF